MDGCRKSRHTTEVIPEQDPQKSDLKWGLLLTLFTIIVGATIGTGISAWMRGSNRSHCILNIRNAQQAVRSYGGVQDIGVGEPIDWTDLVGPGKLLSKEPRCPAGGKYRFLEKYPGIGVLALECSLCNTPQNHKPDKYSDW
jgi:hypothetical protein